MTSKINISAWDLMMNRHNWRDATLFGGTNMIIDDYYTYYLDNIFYNVGTSPCKTAVAELMESFDNEFKEKLLSKKYASCITKNAELVDKVKNLCKKHELNTVNTVFVYYDPELNK